MPPVRRDRGAPPAVVPSGWRAWRRRGVEGGGWGLPTPCGPCRAAVGGGSGSDGNGLWAPHTSLGGEEEGDACGVRVGGRGTRGKADGGEGQRHRGELSMQWAAAEGGWVPGRQAPRRRCGCGWICPGLLPRRSVACGWSTSACLIPAGHPARVSSWNQPIQPRLHAGLDGLCQLNVPIARERRRGAIPVAVDSSRLARRS